MSRLLCRYSRQKLKRIPTIEETKKFSRINKNCGIWIFSAFITAQLIGFGAYKFANYQIPEWILYVVPLLIGSYFPFNVMGKIAQFWTTSKPNDQNIELAISALCALEKRNLYECFVDNYSCNINYDYFSNCNS